MNKRKLILTIGLISSITLLTGGVFAAYSLDDDAGKKGFRIQIQDVQYVDVTFKNADGSDYAKRSVISGNTMGVVPSDPTLEGYVFNGWSTNNSTYAVTTDNFATKTYTSDTVYYPRFARYGYTINGGSPVAISNVQSPANNVAVAANDTLIMGTYIYNKASLENETSGVTISNAGNYSLYCGEKNSTWSSATASNTSNWNIDRYLTVTKAGEWIGKSVIARIYQANNSYEDYKSVQADGNTYYVYGDYLATNIEFYGIYSDSDHQDDILAENANVQYRTDKLSIGANNSFSLSPISYYLTGTFGSNNWSIDSNYVMTVDGENENHYAISNVSLTAGDKIKVRDNANRWFGSNYYTGCGFTLDGTDMVVDKTGVYTIDLYLDATNGNYVVLGSRDLTTTFSVTYPSGGDIYVAGEFNDWNVSSASKITLVDADAGEYSFQVNVPYNSNDEFKYVLNGSDWSTLNPDGNRHMVIGGNNHYEYSVTSNTRTINIYNNFSSSSSWWHNANPTWGVYAYTTNESDGKYYATEYVTTYNGNEDYLIAVVDDTVTKIKVVRCDPAKVSQGSVPVAGDVWNSTGYVSVTSNNYVNIYC